MTKHKTTQPTSPPQDLDESLSPVERVKRKVAQAKAKGQIPTAQHTLPGLEEAMRAMPNHIARCSLFAPVARGRKKLHKDTLLLETPSVVLRFWGEQLDEAQADVWMQLMYEASKAPLGEPIRVNRAQLLRSIGRHAGKYEYEWLRRTAQALSWAMISIVASGKYEIDEKKAKGSQPAEKLLHMIDGYDYDPELEEYVLRVDPRWRHLYGNGEFALIDWDKRLQIGQGQDLAKSLQRLIVTSADTEQRYTLAYLKKRAQYESPMRKFREALKEALHELERLGILAGSGIEVSGKGQEVAVLRRAGK